MKGAFGLLGVEVPCMYTVVVSWISGLLLISAFGMKLLAFVSVVLSKRLFVDSMKGILKDSLILTPVAGFP
tara:strand:- start:33 stop:245 length:213 start_codon:yes stop_codon:yes gene_type:complete